MPDAPPLLLTHAELAALTGYQRPGDQVAELQRQGFTRARRSRTTGETILERAHYLAVSAGQIAPQRPKVRPPKLRLASVA
jgi:hypothetical protein